MLIVSNHYLLAGRENPDISYDDAKLRINLRNSHPTSPYWQDYPNIPYFSFAFAGTPKHRRKSTETLPQEH